MKKTTILLIISAIVIIGFGYFVTTGFQTEEIQISNTKTMSGSLSVIESRYEGQTFTVDSGFTVTKISVIKLQSPILEDVDVIIYPWINGEPDFNTPLSTGVIYKEDITYDYNWTDVVMTECLLESGNQYLLLLEGDGSAGNHVKIGYCHDGYSGGDAVYVFQGTCYIYENDIDILFKIWGK